MKQKKVANGQVTRHLYFWPWTKLFILAFKINPSILHYIIIYYISMPILMPIFDQFPFTLFDRRPHFHIIILPQRQTRPSSFGATTKIGLFSSAEGGMGPSQIHFPHSLLSFWPQYNCIGIGIDDRGRQAPIGQMSGEDGLVTPLAWANAKSANGRKGRDECLWGHFLGLAPLLDWPHYFRRPMKNKKGGGS